MPCILPMFQQTTGSPFSQGCRSLLNIGGGDNLQFNPNFALFSTLGDEPRPQIFSGKQIKRRPQKRSSPKIQEFFSRNLVKTKKRSKHHSAVRCRPKSNYLGWDADVDHSQTIGEDAVKLLGEYIPPILPGFRHPCFQ